MFSWVKNPGKGVDFSRHCSDALHIGCGGDGLEVSPGIYLYFLFICLCVFPFRTLHTSISLDVLNPEELSETHSHSFRKGLLCDSVVQLEVDTLALEDIFPVAITSMCPRLFFENIDKILIMISSCHIHIYTYIVFVFHVNIPKPNCKHIVQTVYIICLVCSICL